LSKDQQPNEFKLVEASVRGTERSKTESTRWPVLWANIAECFFDRVLSRKAAKDHGGPSNIAIPRRLRFDFYAKVENQKLCHGYRFKGTALCFDGPNSKQKHEARACGEIDSPPTRLPLPNPQKRPAGQSGHCFTSSPKDRARSRMLLAWSLLHLGIQAENEPRLLAEKD
jgi:hypothetical protein